MVGLILLFHLIHLIFICDHKKLDAHINIQQCFVARTLTSLEVLSPNSGLESSARLGPKHLKLSIANSLIPTIPTIPP